MAAWKFVGGEIFAAFDDDEINFQRFSCRFETVRKLVDAISGEEELEIKVTNGYRNPTFKITRDGVNEGKIINELAKYGVSLENCEEFQVLAKQIIFETESQLPKTITHNELGFVEINNTECFLADKLYVHDDQFELRSVCAAPQMKPRGSFKQYRNFILKEVCKSPKLSLVFALGVTAPVAYILKKRHLFSNTLLWSFSGETSSGKTTSMISFLSLFGAPDFLLSNLNSTENALVTQISALSGFPFGADEATRTNIDFDELIYSLSSGKGKRRCKGDGTLKPLVNFSGAAFFSSEQPILDKCHALGGEEARIVEFEFPWFDGNGDKAEKFENFFNQHYGVVTEPLAKLLLDPKVQKKIGKNYRRFYAMLKKMVTAKDGVDNRILQRFAIICTACWLLEKALKVGLHMDAIIKLLLQVFQEKQTRICRTDGTERLLQLFVEDYVHNQDRYSSVIDSRKSARHINYASTPRPGSLRGVASKFQGKDCLWLPIDTFNEILNRQTTYGASTAKKKLNEKGYLPKFGNAYYRWYNFGATSANAYCIFLPDQLEMVHEAEEVLPESAPPPTPTSFKVAGFVSLTAQQVDMVLNDELAYQLGLKNKGKLFLHACSNRDFLLLSSKPSKNALPLVFEKVNNSFVAVDASLSSILEATSLNIGRRECLFLSDISIAGKTPSAMIYLDNPHGQICEKNDDRDPYRIPTAFRNRPVINLKNRRSLLDEEDD